MKRKHSLIHEVIHRQQGKNSAQSLSYPQKKGLPPFRFLKLYAKLLHVNRGRLDPFQIYTFPKRVSSIPGYFSTAIKQEKEFLKPMNAFTFSHLIQGGVLK